MMFKRAKSIPLKTPKVLYDNRYCNQEGFSILICGGKDKNGEITNKVFELESPSFKVHKFPSMIKPHYYLNLVNIKSDILAISDEKNLDESLDKSIISTEIYSEKTKSWSNLDFTIKEKCCYCVGSFMGKMYLIGGYNISYEESLSSSYSYNFDSNTWIETAKLNKARDCAACTVFEGKIVVTGGVYYLPQIKSVEAYDYHEDKWTYLPDMIEERSYHAAVSMGNKMFVIGGKYTTSCEVFDSRSRKFSNINSDIYPYLEEYYFDALSIGNHIVVIQKFINPLTETDVYLYDVGKEKWLNVQCDFTEKMFQSNFVKYFS